MKKDNLTTPTTMIEPTELTPELIAEFKASYGRIFKTTIDDEAYIWRQLRRKEYVDIMSEKFETDDPEERLYKRQEAIARMAVLWPMNLDHALEIGGIATSLSDEIIIKSGFEVSGTEEL